MPSESTPLIDPESSPSHPDSTSSSPKHSNKPRLTTHWFSPSPHSSHPSPSTTIRHRIRHFLTSKTGHYLILALVCLDVSSIFTDFLLSLLIAEAACESHGDYSTDVSGLETAQEALGIVGLVFSCLFVVELLLSVWAFGLAYFKSKFHVLDSLVILSSFIVDVCLKGVLEEIGSIVIVLRLWRVFKIIEELSAGAEEQMDALNEKIADLQRENERLKRGTQQAPS